MLLQSNVPNYPVKRGKVRDVYDVGETMLVIVTTDRISAFDHILPNGITDKGKVLTQISLFWANYLDVYYHIISTDPAHMPDAFKTPELEGRSMFVEKAKVIPFECVVRGYLCGSGWKDYQRTGEICGIKLPPGLKENQQFPSPIFTPATKAEVGHDENVPCSRLVEALGNDLASELESRSIGLYMQAAEYAWNKGIIIADTKFEWGTLPHSSDDLALIDEVLTPDSSRLWALEDYQLGVSIPSFDKQPVRNWLEASGWDKNSPPPELPPEIVEQTRQRYLEAYKKITGKDL